MVTWGQLHVTHPRGAPGTGQVLQREGQGKDWRMHLGSRLPDFIAQGRHTCHVTVLSTQEGKACRYTCITVKGLKTQFPGGSACEVSGAASLALPHFVLVSILWGGYDSNFIGETEA